MPTSTYNLIASNVLSSSVSSVTFSSIPATYRDLILVIDGIFTTANYPAFRFNGDAGSNYPAVTMRGTGSAASSTTFTENKGGFTLDAGTKIYGIAHIFDYAQTDKHKTFLSRGSSPSVETMAYCGRWANTAAITSIEIFRTLTGNYNAGSTFYLYGIAG